ncbi:MAG: hypothetical protein WAN11_18945 [Syntrophobacteraceae bacterium]
MSESAYVYDDRVIGIQFRLESTVVSLREIVRNCRDEIADGRHITFCLSGEV